MNKRIQKKIWVWVCSEPYCNPRKYRKRFKRAREWKHIASNFDRRRHWGNHWNPRGRRVDRLRYIAIQTEKRRSHEEWEKWLKQTK